MREMLDEKLSRFEELEKQLADPEVQSQFKSDGCGGQGTWFLGQIGCQVS